MFGTHCTVGGSRGIQREAIEAGGRYAESDRSANPSATLYLHFLLENGLFWLA